MKEVLEGVAGRIDVGNIQLLLKRLNTPADVLCQLPKSISLILRLYACSTSTILIASVQRP